MAIEFLVLVLGIYALLELISNFLQRARIEDLDRRVTRLEGMCGNHSQRQDHHH